MATKEIMELANNWNNVEDPFPGSGIMTPIRIAYEQFPYQEQLVDLIPRYLTILTATKPSSPSLDIPGVFHSKTRLSIEKLMKIGLGV